MVKGRAFFFSLQDDLPSRNSRANSKQAFPVWGAQLFSKNGGGQPTCDTIVHACLFESMVYFFLNPANQNKRNMKKSWVAW